MNKELKIHQKKEKNIYIYIYIYREREREREREYSFFVWANYGKREQKNFIINKRRKEESK